MNTAKKNTVLFIVLIVQVALVAFLYRPGRNAPPPAANIFTSLDPAKVMAMTVTDDQGKSIALTKKDGAWQLGLDGFPADQAKIEGLLKKLADSKSSRLVSQTAASHTRLKVADGDFNRKIELSQGDAKTVFYLGTAPSSKSIHLRLAEAKEVYQINDLAAWEVPGDMESWWQGRYLSQPLSDLTALTITNALGTIDLVKKDDKTWQLKDQPETALEAARVESLLNSVSEITVASYQAKAFAPKGQPVATITYHVKDGGPTVQIWAKEKPEAADLAVKASTSGFYAMAKEYAFKEAMEIKAEMLIAKPPAVEPGTESLDATAKDRGVPAIPPPATTAPGK